MNATSFFEKLTLAEMLKQEDWSQWQQAVREKMDSLTKNDTWTMAKLPEGRKPISCKWVFKVKRSNDGGADRYKARLVARGFSQRHGFDYSETYSPVAKLDTVKSVLAVANQERWHITKEIYMTPPEGCTHKKNGLIFRLNRALYGLKQ